MSARSGPLVGLRVVEMDCPGPCQFAGMLLSDLGASVIRVGRPVAPDATQAIPPRFDYLARGRPELKLDLRQSTNVAIVQELCRHADVLLEGFRPGAMERLGLGPEELRASHPGLIYGRATGWGQEGPLAKQAGHDINFIALTGALHAARQPGGAPVPPLNLLGDYGAGGMLLVVGVLSAWFERQRSGCGQVVDAAIVDGTLLMTTLFHGLRAAGRWGRPPGENFYDGGAPMYGVYQTADGEYLSVGPLEPKFYAEFLTIIGVDSSDVSVDYCVANWNTAKDRIARAIRRRTRAEWEVLFAASDACVAPVLSFEETLAHPHHRARSGFVDVDGQLHPAPAPRFSRTPASRPKAPESLDLATVLREFCLDETSIETVL